MSSLPPDAPHATPPSRPPRAGGDGRLRRRVSLFLLVARVRAAALTGQCLLALGAVREADRVFRSVVAEQPDQVDAHRGLAVIAYDLGQLGEAVEHLRRVAELDAADPRPHRLIGLIYKDM